MTKLHKFKTGIVLLTAAAILIAAGFGIAGGVAAASIAAGVTLVVYGLGFFIACADD